MVKPAGQKNVRKDGGGGNMSQTRLTELQEQKLLQEIEELNRIQLQKLQELAQIEEAEKKAAKANSPKNAPKKAIKELDPVKEKEKRAFKAGAKDVNPAPIINKLKAKVVSPMVVKAPAVEEWNEAAQRDQQYKVKGRNGQALAGPGGNVGCSGGGGYAAAPVSPIPNIHLNLAGPNQPLPVELGEVAGGFGAGAGYLRVYKKKKEDVERKTSNPRGRRGAGGGDGQDGLSANGDAQSEGRLFQNRRREGELQQAKYAPAYEETISLPAIPSARNAKSSGSSRVEAIRQGAGYQQQQPQGYYAAPEPQSPPFVHPLDGQNRRVLNSSRNNTMSAPSRLHDPQPDDDSYYSGNNGYANVYVQNAPQSVQQQQNVPQNMHYNLRGPGDRSCLPVPVKVSHDYVPPNQQAVPIYNMQKKVSSKAVGGGGGGYSNNR